MEKFFLHRLVVLFLVVSCVSFLREGKIPSSQIGGFCTFVEWKVSLLNELFGFVPHRLVSFLTRWVVPFLGGLVGFVPR